jgi:hypothetical protein
LDGYWAGDIFLKRTFIFFQKSEMKKDSGQKQIGFYYTVSDEQIKEHRQRSVKEIFEWLESTNEFLWRFQTPIEKERMRKIRKGEY